jgi:hypothetical protein
MIMPARMRRELGGEDNMIKLQTEHGPELVPTFEYWRHNAYLLGGVLTRGYWTISEDESLEEFGQFHSEDQAARVCQAMNEFFGTRGPGEIALSVRISSEIALPKTRWPEGAEL